LSERYLADEDFPGPIVRFLRNRGDDVLYAAESMPGTPDEAVLRIASELDRILLTFDRDFGELVVPRQQPVAGVVLFRVKRQSPEVLYPLLETFFDSPLQLRGFFTVVTLRTVRQRRLT